MSREDNFVAGEAEVAPSGAYMPFSNKGEWDEIMAELNKKFPDKPSAIPPTDPNPEVKSHKSYKNIRKKTRLRKR